MKKIAFYKIIDNLHKLTVASYKKHIKAIVQDDIFKKSVQEKKIKVSYLSKNMFSNQEKNIHLKVD